MPPFLLFLLVGEAAFACLDPSNLLPRHKLRGLPCCDRAYPLAGQLLTPHAYLDPHAIQQKQMQKYTKYVVYCFFVNWNVWKRLCSFEIQLSHNTTTWPVRTCCQVRFCDCSLQLHATTCEWVSGTRQKTQWEIIEGRHMSDRLQPKSQRHRALPCISRVKRATPCNSLVPNQKVGWNSAGTFCLCANCAYDAIHSHIATLHILPAWLAETPFNFSVTWWPKVFNQQQWCTCQGFCKQETCVSFPTMTQAPKYHYHIWQDCVSISAFHKTTRGKILLLGLLHTRDCCAGLLVFIRNPFSAPAKTVASTLLIWMKSGMQSYNGSDKNPIIHRWKETQF